MSFGVWVALLDRGGHSTHEGRQLRYHDTLWLRALRHAFPSGPGHQKKTNRGLRTVQSLRNRIGHHEKIFKEPFKDTSLIGRDALIEACRITGSRLVVVEDHYPEGGLGAAVLESLANAQVPALHLEQLAVRDLPGSGTPAELLNEAGISAAHIVDAAHRLVTS